MAKELDNADPNAQVDVIIQFKNIPTDAHHKKVKDKGGSHKKHLDAIKGGSYSVSGRHLAALAADPDVAYLSPDRPVKGALDYARQAVNASIAQQYGWTGAGIGIAVIDSGVDGPDVAPQVVYNQTFIGGDAKDHYGHGSTWRVSEHVVMMILSLVRNYIPSYQWVVKGAGISPTASRGPTIWKGWRSEQWPQDASVWRC